MCVRVTDVTTTTGFASIKVGTHVARGEGGGGWWWDKSQAPKRGPSDIMFLTKMGSSLNGTCSKNQSVQQLPALRYRELMVVVYSQI